MVLSMLKISDPSRHEFVGYYFFWYNWLTSFFFFAAKIMLVIKVLCQIDTVGKSACVVYILHYLYKIGKTLSSVKSHFIKEKKGPNILNYFCHDKIYLFIYKFLFFLSLISLFLFIIWLNLNSVILNRLLSSFRVW